MCHRGGRTYEWRRCDGRGWWRLEGLVVVGLQRGEALRVVGLDHSLQKTLHGCGSVSVVKTAI
jgi:hypothetical protein